MAEVVAVIASCVSIVECLDAVCTFMRENVHSRDSARQELTLLAGKLSSYRGIIFGIQLQAEIDKYTHDRLSALAQVSGPLKACELASNLINKRLRNLPKNFVFGKVIDKETAESLKVLDNALPVLQLALHADQRVITAEVEKYVKAIKWDLSSLRSANEAMREDVSDVRQIITDQMTQQDGQKRDAEKRNIVEWLTKCHPSTIYQSCVGKASPSSGRWLLDHDFHDWLERSSENTPRVMWLRGKSGVGKTTLFSLAIRYLQGRRTGIDAPLCAYFYCSFSAKETQSASNMTGSYLTQLYDQVPGVDEIVKSLQAESKSRHSSELESPSVEDLERTLSQALGMTNRVVVLFLDAPNESDTGDEMVEVLSRLVSSHDNLQVLISSTADIDLPRMLQAYSQFVVIDASYQNVNPDIYRYVEARMQHERRLWKLPQDIKDKIKDTLTSKADGSFRWVECQITCLVEKARRSEAAIEDALRSISPGLEGLYTSALLSTPSTDRPLLRSALLWLTFAIRPLHVTELGEAMIFNGCETSIEAAKRLFVEGVEDILRNCRMLIHYNAESGYATLAHSSVQQFLTSEQCKTSPVGMFYFDESEDLCELSCLVVDYLNMPCFASGHCARQGARDRRKVEWPLLQYVSDAMPTYMRVMRWPLSATRYRTERALQKFFGSASRPRGGNYGTWVQVYLPRHVRPNQSLSHPLYYAARAGMVEVVRLILRVEGKGALELQGGTWRSTPLHVACAYGHTATVKLLLEEGADPNERNGQGERGMEWAWCYPDIVELLLQYGAAPLEEAKIDARILRLKRDMTRAAEKFG